MSNNLLSSHQCRRALRTPPTSTVHLGIAFYVNEPCKEKCMCVLSHFQLMSFQVRLFSTARPDR